jgi:hypothetical protein
VRTTLAVVNTFLVSGSGPAAYERYAVPALFRPLAEAAVATAGPLADWIDVDGLVLPAEWHLFSAVRA